MLKLKIQEANATQRSFVSLMVFGAVAQKQKFLFSLLIFRS